MALAEKWSPHPTSGIKWSRRWYPAPVWTSLNLKSHMGGNPKYGGKPSRRVEAVTEMLLKGSVHYSIT